MLLNTRKHEKLFLLEIFHQNKKKKKMKNQEKEEDTIKLDIQNSK